MFKKSGLGKGLEALFEENFKINNKEIFFLDVSKIKPNKEQPRQDFNDEKLKTLAESIKNNGIIQPILVRELKEDEYQIIAGERRFRAAKMVGLKEVPVIVKNMEERNVTEIALIENLQREDLNPVEEAKGFLNLIKKYGLTQEEVAKKVGRSRSYVTNTIRLLNLPQEVIEEIKKGNLSSGHARALLSLKDEEEVKRMAVEVVEKGISVRDIEKIASFKRDESKKTNKQEKEHIFKEFEKKLQEELKRKVIIKMISGEKGRITIDFYNRDELMFMANSLKSLRS